MAFINEIYRYKKIFRDIEKATKKCVYLNGAIEFNKTCLTNGTNGSSHISIHIYIYKYKCCLYNKDIDRYNFSEVDHLQIYYTYKKGYNYEMMLSYMSMTLQDPK